jgi:uncharacterized membrane protein
MHRLLEVIIPVVVASVITMVLFVVALALEAAHFDRRTRRRAGRQSALHRVRRATIDELMPVVVEVPE